MDLVDHVGMPICSKEAVCFLAAQQLTQVGVKDYGDGEQFQETKVRQIHR